MLKINNISREIGEFAVRDVSLAVDKGDYFVILGRSGAGKSLLVELIAGLMMPDSGRMEFDGVDLEGVSAQHRRMGLVFQEQNLFPHMSVRKNISYPILASVGKSGKDIDSKVERLAGQTGCRHLLERRPSTLSLGESQRVALARALAVEPKLLVLDEPLASLDVQSKVEIRRLLRQINADGMTVLHVTHDYQDAIALASRVAIIDSGSVAQLGTPEQVFHHPKSEFVAGLTGVKNFYRGELKKEGDLEGVFSASGQRFFVATNAAPGTGCLVIRSDNVVLSMAEHISSERNHYHGSVVDLEPVDRGIDVTVDIGVPIVSLVTKKSCDAMTLGVGDKVHVSFKATAAEYIAE